MFRDITNFMDYGIAQASSSVLFALAFILLMYGLLRLSHRTMDRYASIPLSDHLEASRDDD